ncbi:Rieske 2Fe-2S domain-containing protein [Pusillimonas sp. SM2304]|uniref:Rieske (2Fe-2S) protein n=1 Tax=Pusillimonas sp. SM2304 TaxID=3073241 RepID=UPI0028742BE9|nr:Rieske 2Fe-2S domain-containing protein [Pusillimonas sp. SM2304]MDS1139147.1 Rieske 2Fe-2S domain-containing protein [Pusillimonas sp. SM2304]
MTDFTVTVCPSSDLVDGGLACKLPVQHAGQATTALFIRYNGQARGYLNRCPHAGSELDWEGHVFTRAGDLLMCARHGATFKPDTGDCTGGPCLPSRLSALHVSEEERDGKRVVLWRPEGKTQPA